MTKEELVNKEQDKMTFVNCKFRSIDVLLQVNVKGREMKDRVRVLHRAMQRYLDGELKELWAAAIEKEWVRLGAMTDMELAELDSQGDK